MTSHQNSQKINFISNSPSQTYKLINQHMTKIIPKQIHYNSFDQSTFKKIKSLLQSIPSDHYQRKLTHNIKDAITFATDLPKESMLWIIGQDPVYFVQTKKDSSAIFRIEGVSVIVYAPKFLEYPQIAQIPVFKEVPENPGFKVSKVEAGVSITPGIEAKISSYILAYYSTKYPGDGTISQFQQQFLTHLKHKLSKQSGTLYWHLIMDTKNTQITFLEDMPYRMVYRIEGPKVDKYLYLYSQKGVNNSIVKIMKGKWKQILTFIMLFVMLMTVAMCPDDGEEKPSYCASKGTIFYIIGGFFMVMVGMKIADRKKKKLPGSRTGAEKSEERKKEDGSEVEKEPLKQE